MRGLDGRETLYLLLTYNGNPVPTCTLSSLLLEAFIVLFQFVKASNKPRVRAAKSKRLGMAKNVRIDCLPTDRLTADRGMGICRELERYS